MTETRTQGKISRPKATPTVATRQRARFLVVGTAIAETILHQPGGEERRGLGGVAATIALETRLKSPAVTGWRGG